MPTVNPQNRRVGTYSVRELLLLTASIAVVLTLYSYGYNFLALAVAGFSSGFWGAVRAAWRGRSLLWRGFVFSMIAGVFLGTTHLVIAFKKSGESINEHWSELLVWPAIACLHTVPFGMIGSTLVAELVRRDRAKLQIDETLSTDSDIDAQLPT